MYFIKLLGMNYLMAIPTLAMVRLLILTRGYKWQTTFYFSSCSQRCLS